MHPLARVFAVAAASSLLAARASAQTRPLQTESAETASAGSLRLEAGAQVVAGEPNFQTGKPRERWDLAELLVSYSPAGNVEFRLGWTGRILAVGDRDLGDVSDWGDVVLGAKVRFLEQSQYRPALSARFGITLPETRAGAGLGPNELRMAAQFLLSKTLGRVTAHANLGLALHDRPLMLQSQSDFLAWGLALTGPIGRSTEFLAEAAGLAGEGEPGADPHAEVRVGVRTGAGRVRWDVALRRGLLSADGGWGLTAGLAWSIR